jgi:cytochrome c oxidase subunit 1
MRLAIFISDSVYGMIIVAYLLTALFPGGFGSYLIPLMVDARDMVFPFLNMLSYWVSLLPVLILASLVAFITAFTMGGLNYVTTVLQSRCHRLTMMRLPLSVWGIFVTSCLGLFAFPALLVACIMKTLDTSLSTSFFMPAIIEAGQALSFSDGSPILFQP